MPHDIRHRPGGTEIGFGVPTTEDPLISAKRAQCKADGGTWDDENKVCVFPSDVAPFAQQPKGLEIPEPEPEKEEDKPTVTEVTPREQAERAGDIQPQEIGQFGGTVPGEITIDRQREIAQGQALAGQVGQFTPAPVSPTGLDVGEGITTGLVDFIPRGIQAIAGLNLFGGAVAAATGATAARGSRALGTNPRALGTNPRALAAGGGALRSVGFLSKLLGRTNPYVAGAIFVAGIASSMISNFRSQRRDTTTAQQRVLDEGKQTLKDWATLAEADPANKELYLTQFNKVSAQIDQAYRQMVLDTNRDVTKFETALPNLAEFEAFYAAGGERDALNIEMRNALLSPADPANKMLELADRRGDGSTGTS